ncbi:MAG: S9 family peptidase [Acidobacteria bacterium]|nr:S9 family peptidase [Acidobacteriota bacterium]
MTLALMTLAAAPPPESRKEGTVDVLHGVSVPDPYRWLEDQDSPETRAWLKAQIEYTNSFVHSVPRRPAIVKRLTELMRVESVEVSHTGGYFFFLKRTPEQDQAVLIARHGEKGKDEVLIDPNAWGGSKSISLMDHSPDGKLLAYGIRKGGEDEVEVHFLNIETKKEFGEVLPRARFLGVSILPAGKGVIYSQATKDGPRLYENIFGQQPKLIFGEELGPSHLLYNELSPDGRYVLLTAAMGSASEQDVVHVLRLSDRQLIPINTDIKARFRGSIGGDTLFVQTNWNAPRQRILAIDLNKPERENWKEIIPQSQWNIESMNLTGRHIAINTLENVLSKTRLYTPAGKLVREIKFPGIGSGSNLAGSWDDDVAFTTFKSFTEPTATFLHSVASGASREYYRQKVPVERQPVTVTQKWFTSKDGTKVPMFLAYRSDRKLDGSMPMLLYGYGGFTVSVTPYFSATYNWWIEHGGAVAMVNLRGGSEFGEEWHKSGMLDKKQNVFDDFIAAAEWLIANKYTRTERLAIYGGSNGGLLVGAAMTQRPELYGAVVCSVPLLDMVRFHLFKVARYWTPEYGSAEDSAQFAYIYKYSPYHNVKDGVKYPATMFVSGDSDTRVDPLHARKMTARVQAANASGKPVLLHYDTEGGHSAGLPIAKQIENAADLLTFLVSQVFPKPR